MATEATLAQTEESSAQPMGNRPSDSRREPREHGSSFNTPALRCPEQSSQPQQFRAKLRTAEAVPPGSRNNLDEMRTASQPECHVVFCVP